jgi:hypothetical protein
MVFSPFRSAISHAPRDSAPKPGEPFVSHHPRGSWLPYGDAKVMEVRRLIETTVFSYGQIVKRVGVSLATVGRWTNNGQWVRPLFAPVSADRVPTWRAGRYRRRRMLGLRLHALAERHIRELEAGPAVDPAKLREALELLKMVKLAERPHRGPRRLAKAVDTLAELQARARVIADLRENGVDIARAPGEALADFIESCAPAPKPRDDRALRERGRYSKRKREHAWMLERE